MRRFAVAVVTGVCCLWLAACSGEYTGPDAATLTAHNQAGEWVEIYFTMCSEDTWGTSWGRLDEGEIESWSIEPGCWDLRAECRGDTPALEERGVDIPANTTYQWIIGEDSGC